MKGKNSNFIQFQTKLKDAEFIKEIITNVDPIISDFIHKARLDLSYTNFDGKKISSPFHSINKINIIQCQMITLLLLGTLEGVVKLLEQTLPIYIEPIKECYKETDRKKISAQKKEINRRIKRSKPAFYKYLDELLNEKLGFNIENLGNPKVNELFATFSSDIWLQHLSNIKKLILSNDKIEEIYFYQPLKENAKKYYLSLE
jgi:hypothetical protein